MAKESGKKQERNSSERQEKGQRIRKETEQGLGI